MQVGVRFYQTRIFNDHKCFLSDPTYAPQDISNEVRGFIMKHSKSNLIKVASSDDGAGGEKRSHRFLPEKDDFHSLHGLIRYGTFGYATEVENVNSGVIKYSRTLEEADTIPLYYRFWWPPGYSYGLWAFQSYSGRSCASTILSEFRSDYRNKFDGWKFEAKKIVPSELAQFAKAKVKKLTLVKKRVPSNTVVKSLRPVELNSEVDVEMEVRARGTSVFGKLADIPARLAGNMDVGGFEYTGAYATIMVDGKPKKIGVLGVSTNSGVIDLSSEIDVDEATKMPTFPSVASAVKAETEDFAKRLGV